MYHLFQPDEYEVYGLAHDLLTNSTNRFQFVTLPRISSPSSVSAIFDGDHAYMFSGYFNNIGVPIAWKFDPATGTTERLRILYDGTAYPEHHESCGIYVPKEKRVYFFAGLSGSRYISAVMYIDLYPEEDPITTEESYFTTPYPEKPEFNCTGREDGDFFPNPEECEKYFGCWDSEAYAFNCSHPLIFDVIERACKFPGNVDCDVGCDGKEDGLHAHSYYCNLYRECRDGERSLFACDKPLIFDPSIGSCNDPGSVECLGDVY